MDKVINLSFDDSRLNVYRVDGIRTGVRMCSYFANKKLQKFFEEFGFETLPDMVRNILKKHGYKYDYKLNGWCTTTKAITTLMDTDEDSQIKANNIAITKAKARAYKKAVMVMDEIYDKLTNLNNIIFDSKERLSYIRNIEYVGLENAMETGYSDPEYNK